MSSCGGQYRNFRRGHSKGTTWKIKEWVALHGEIARYAAQSADTADDLDEGLEAASLEHLHDAEKHR